MPQIDTGQPEGNPRRVLRVPADGVITARKRNGDHLEEGDVVAVINLVSDKALAMGGCMLGAILLNLRSEL